MKLRGFRNASGLFAQPRCRVAIRDLGEFTFTENLVQHALAPFGFHQVSLQEFLYRFPAIVQEIPEDFRPCTDLKKLNTSIRFYK